MWSPTIRCAIAAGTPGLDVYSPRSLRFTVLTGEVFSMTWGEINLTAKLWTIPGERTKGGRQHRVPLSEQRCRSSARQSATRSSARAPVPTTIPGRPPDQNVPCCTPKPQAFGAAMVRNFAVSLLRRPTRTLRQQNMLHLSSRFQIGLLASSSEYSARLKEFRNRIFYNPLVDRKLSRIVISCCRVDRKSWQLLLLNPLHAQVFSKPIHLIEKRNLQILSTLAMIYLRWNGGRRDRHGCGVGRGRGARLFCAAARSRDGCRAGADPASLLGSDDRHRRDAVLRQGLQLSRPS